MDKEKSRGFVKKVVVEEFKAISKAAFKQNSQVNSYENKR